MKKSLLLVTLLLLCIFPLESSGIKDTPNPWGLPGSSSLEEGLEKVEVLLKTSKQKEAEELFIQIFEGYSARFMGDARTEKLASEVFKEHSKRGLNQNNYPYYLYLVADYYDSCQDREEENSRRAIKVLNKIRKDYPQAVFPDTERSLIPLVQIKIAELWKDFNPSEAIIEYRKAEEKYPDEIIDFCFYGKSKVGPRALLKIGYVYEKKIKNYQQAINSYKEVVKKYPQYYENNELGENYPAATAQFRIVGIYKENLRDNHKAFWAAKELLDLEDHSFVDLVEEKEGYMGASRGEALCLLGEICQDLNEPSQALKYYQKILKERSHGSMGGYATEYSESYDLRALRGITSAGIKALGAEKTLLELRNIEGTHWDGEIKAYAQYFIGTIYEEVLKDKSKAIEEYRKVIDKYPEMKGDDFKTGLVDLAEEKIKELTK